jgi:nitrite reductase/ring-hydroxylating ferredoxin subunit
MLSKRDNELITRVGPETPMGALMRRYWLPALLSEELPEPDCAPIKLRLLGEDLVAFRTTSGRVGVLDAYCPHRNANLFWGRNEEEGLRCVYHGWKFDASGACVDMPNEPPRSRFAEKIQQSAYQAVERGGFIWVYMGPPEHHPEIPNFEWLNVAESHRYVHKRFQDCNWLQNLEGEVDSSHAPFLHGSVGPDGMQPYNANADRQPVFSILDTDFGVAIAARRDAGADEYYWRVTPFMLPCYTIVPRARESNYIWTAAVPIDDLTMFGMTVIWSPDHPVQRFPVVEIDDHFRARQNKANDYLIDRQLQKTSSFTGIRGVRVQDMAVQEDQRGPLSDRSREHLGSSDLGVIATRRMLLKQLKALQKGQEPRQPHSPDAYSLRSLALNAPRSVDWQDLMRQHMLLAPRDVTLGAP